MLPVTYTKKQRGREWGEQEGKLEWPVREVILMIVGFPGVSRNGEASDIYLYWEFEGQD